MWTLKLSHNFIGFVLEKDKKCDTFAGLSNVRDLDLADNRIWHLPANVFKGLRDVVSLNLSTNSIRDLILNADNFRNLMSIDLSYNQFARIPVRLYNILDENAQNQTIYLNISNNPIQCTCDTLEFLQWMKEN